MSDTIKRYQVDAFAENIFQGNPAVVCPLTHWLPDDLMQKIAMENNLSETAFYVKEVSGYRIRWFTPTVEVDLCGHATLATAFVLFNFESFSGNEISFQSRSGILKVSKTDHQFTLNFPVDIVHEVKATPGLTDGFNVHPSKILKGKPTISLFMNRKSRLEIAHRIFSKFQKLMRGGL